MDKTLGGTAKIGRPFLDACGIIRKGKQSVDIPVIHNSKPLDIEIDGLKGVEPFGADWLPEGSAKNIAILWKFIPWKRDFCQNIERLLPAHVAIVFF